MREGSGGVLVAKCVPGRNSKSHFLHRTEKKPRGGFAAKKNVRVPGFFAGEMRTRSHFKFAFSSGGSIKRKTEAVPPKKYARASGLFPTAKFAPRRNSNLIFFQRALKKDSETVSPRKKIQVPVVRFLRRNAPYVAM